MNSKSPAKPHIIVIDPAVRTPETDCFNNICFWSSLPCTFHLPAMLGIDSLNQFETPLLSSGAIKGIIILGSASSVIERLPWQIHLENWLTTTFEHKIPILGICYGHQMLAYMFGGKVTYHTPEQIKLTGFREVKFSENKLFSNLSGPLVISHNEIVSTCPSNMKVIATAKDINIDALEHLQLPIWSMQAHPEATPLFLKTQGITVANEALYKLEFGQSLVKNFLKFCHN